MSIERPLSTKEAPEASPGINDALIKLKDQILKQKDIINMLTNELAPLLKPIICDKTPEPKKSESICECASRIYDMSNLIGANTMDIEYLLNNINF